MSVDGEGHFVGGVAYPSVEFAELCGDGVALRCSVCGDAAAGGAVACVRVFADDRSVAGSAFAHVRL